MPYLSVLHKKSKQLYDILEVQNAAVKCFTRMEEDIEQWHKLLQLQQPGQNRAKCAPFVIDSQQNVHDRDLSEPLQQHYQQPEPVFQKIFSLAEQPIYQYKHDLPPPPTPSQGTITHPPPPT